MKAFVVGRFGLITFQNLHSLHLFKIELLRKISDRRQTKKSTIAMMLEGNARGNGQPHLLGKLSILVGAVSHTQSIAISRTEGFVESFELGSCVEALVDKLLTTKGIRLHELHQ